MAAVSDAVVVDLLGRVDQVWGPVVRVLGRPPESAPPGIRARWWADRVSRVVAAVSASPRFFGKLADLLPLQDTVGAAVQSLVVLGVAHEHGLTASDGPDRCERIALMARLLLDRTLTTEQVSTLLDSGLGVYVDEAFGTAKERSGTLGVGRSLLRVAGLLGRVDDLLDARPRGGWLPRLLSNVPVVGVVGGYLAEESALREVAKAAQGELKQRHGPAPAELPPTS